MSKFEETAARYAPYVLSILRIMFALCLLQHGLTKYFGFPGNAPANLSTLYRVAGGLEIVFGILLLVGFFTQLSAFILSGELALAYFIGHAPRGFYPLTNGGEAAVLFCFGFLYLACAGGGPWSLDAMMRRR